MAARHTRGNITPEWQIKPEVYLMKVRCFPRMKTFIKLWDIDPELPLFIATKDGYLNKLPPVSNEFFTSGKVTI